MSSFETSSLESYSFESSGQCSSCFYTICLLFLNVSMKESLTIKIWTMLGLEQRLGEQYMKAMKRPATQTEDGFHTPEAKQGLVSSDLDGGHRQERGVEHQEGWH